MAQDSRLVEGAGVQVVFCAPPGSSGVPKGVCGKVTSAPWQRLCSIVTHPPLGVIDSPREFRCTQRLQGAGEDQSPPASQGKANNCSQMLSRPLGTPELPGGATL